MLAVAILPQSAASQPQELFEKTKQPTEAPTLGEVSFAMHRFEESFFGMERGEEEVRRANAAFDTAAGLWVRGEAREAFRTLSEEWVRLEFGENPEILVKFGATLALDAEPAVEDRQKEKQFYQFHVRQVYEIDTPSTSFREVLALQDPEGYIHWGGLMQGRVYTGEYWRNTFSPLLRQSVLMEGGYELKMMIGPEGTPKEELAAIPIGRAWSSEYPVVDTKKDVGSRLDMLRADWSSAEGDVDAGLSRAGEMLASRLELLTIRPSDEWLAQMSTNHAALARDVVEEIEALESGENPYASRVGDLWFRVKLGEAQVPVQLYAPSSVIGKGAVPVVFAFGAVQGGETMWNELYGAGKLPKLAEERGFLMVAADTAAFAADPALASELLDHVGELYDIDRDRVHVIGHSSGGPIAASAAPLVGARAAAIFSSAPAVPAHADVLPRVMFVWGESDGLYSADGVRESADAFAAEGVNVEIRTLPNYGHLLVVGAALEDAVEWLLHSSESAE